MSKDFLVKLFDGTSRADDFTTVFGRTEVCVKSFIPELANLPGFDESQLVYKLDLDELTSEERERLIAFLSSRFEVLPSVVRDLIDRVGVPILAKDCTLTVLNPIRWLDDDDEWDSRRDSLLNQP